MTQGKLVLYLESVILPRGSLLGHKRKNRREEDLPFSPLSLAGVEKYVCAILSLYKEQAALGINKEDTPRGMGLKGLLGKYLRQLFAYLNVSPGTVKRMEGERKRSAHSDRARGTLADGLKQSDSENINKFFMNKNNENGLRDRLNHILSSAMFLRGDNARMFELADFFTMELRQEGPQQCQALVSIMNHGKTNADGRNEYGSCIRNKDVDECPIGAMALYLFMRFQVNGEQFPDLQRRDNWYKTVLFKDKSPTTAVTYHQQHHAAKKSHTSCGVKISKVTHAPRSFAATKTLSDGASYDHVRAGGRWKGGKMERCYINDLPRVAMRIQAGFPKKQGSFFLKRAVVTPSMPLQQLVFPEVDDWLQKLDNEDYQCDGDIAAQNFAYMMRNFRVVVLQDSILLRATFPDHPIWQHSVWQSELYQQFVTQVQAVPDMNPFEIEIQNVIPLVADRLRVIEQQHLQLSTNQTNVYNDVKTELALLTTSVNDLTTRKLNGTIAYDK